MANIKTIKEIFEEDGGKELCVWIAEEISSLYNQLDEKDSDRDTDQYNKGQIAFAKRFLDTMDQIKKSK